MSAKVNEAAEKFKCKKTKDFFNIHGCVLVIFLVGMMIIKGEV